MTVAIIKKPGSRESMRVCLRYVLRHPVAFREYFVPKASRRRFWHRHTFTPTLMMAAAGDTLLAAGRGSGKSYCFLEPELVRKALARPGEETLVTSLRRIHIVDRLERVIDYFEHIPLFHLFLQRVVRAPAYVVYLKNGHLIHGISVGDDIEARMAQGKHASTLIVEESQQFPLRAWLKIQGAKDPRGCTTTMVGVPDGRLDTPFRKADTDYAAFEGRRIHASRRHDPYFDQKTKHELEDVLGGEDQDLYKQEVDAEWGHPVWSAWDIDAIYRCMEPEMPRVVVEISGKQYRQHGLTPQVACADLPGPDRIGLPTRIAMDVGYSQPSEIGVWTLWHDRWRLVARVRLVNRMEHDDQAKIVAEIARRYEAEQIGIDTTEGEGRAIATELEAEPAWKDRIVRVGSNETHATGWTPEGKEVTEPARAIATRTLRTMWSHRDLAIPKDEDIVSEFNQELEARSLDGSTRVITPPHIHVTDSMRVFAIMRFLDNPPVPAEPGDKNEFVLPEYGSTGIWQSDAKVLTGA